MSNLRKLYLPNELGDLCFLLHISSHHNVENNRVKSLKKISPQLLLLSNHLKVVNHEMHEDTVEKRCSLHVKLESSVMPRSLAALTSSSSFPKRNSLKSLTLAVICRLPNITNFVLSGLSKSSLSKHQFRILSKSLFIFAITACWSWSWNDISGLVSLT